jgi:YbbR domain-containing protein
MIRRLLRAEMTGNLLWLAVSALLATGVWYIAVTSADPIRQRRFYGIPIQFVPSSTAVMTNNVARSADVTIQGSQTIVSSRLASDIVVRADLSRLGPGTHSVPLAVEVVKPNSDSFRRLVSRVEPAQISIELEPRESRDNRIAIELVKAPPIGFRNDEPQPNVDVVLVSGAASLVSQVVAVRGQLDLSASRNPLEVDLRLHAIDADGNRVTGVELEPQTASVAVNISRRDDIRQIAVRPNVLLSTLPDGFTLKNQSYEPESLFVSGAPDQLEKISDTLLTAPISLEGREEGFVTSVPVQLPDDELFVMGGDSNITVSIEIIPIVVSRQIDSIEVGHIGLGDGFDVSIVPKTASAIVTGPVVYVDALSLEDIQLVVDLDGLTPGVYDLSPSISITVGDLSEANVSLSPAELNVEIRSPEAANDNESAADVSADN